jgi:FKBP-type peptidyl-prolyl cis-trans isomerase FkpA
VKPGDGKAVAAGNSVTINYRGWLTDGREFDETYKTGKAFTFQEGGTGVIEGLSQAIFGMKEGGQRRLIIPPTVGYGAAGKDPIPPDAMMIFDVELVSAK